MKKELSGLKTKYQSKKYKVEIVPYDDKAVRYSAVFCINENGIWGKLYKDQLAIFNWRL